MCTVKGKEPEALFAVTRMPVKPEIAPVKLTLKVNSDSGIEPVGIILAVSRLHATKKIKRRSDINKGVISRPRRREKRGDRRRRSREKGKQIPARLFAIMEEDNSGDSVTAHSIIAEFDIKLEHTAHLSNQKKLSRLGHEKHNLSGRRFSDLLRALLFAKVGRRFVNRLEVPAIVPHLHTFIKLANADVDRRNHKFGATINAPFMDNEVVFEPLNSVNDGWLSHAESLSNRRFGSLHATSVSLTASEIHEDFEHRSIRSTGDQFETALLIHHAPATFQTLTVNGFVG